MAGPDPIAVAECAQYLHRSGYNLPALIGDDILREEAAASLRAASNMDGAEAAVMVAHLAEKYEGA